MDERVVNFWANAFNLSLEDIKNNKVEFVTEGKYVSRDPDGRFYFYYDEQNTKKIFATSENKMKEFLKSHSSEELFQKSYKNILKLDYFKSKEMMFNDIDHYLMDLRDYAPEDYSSLEIILIDQNISLENFYKNCTEDEIDTLDLILDDEMCFSYGVLIGNEVVAISQGIILPETEILDLTVLVNPSSRGRGYATQIVSKVIDEGLKKGLYPRYRVKENNLASSSIAKKLGFKRTHQILVWELKS